MSSRALVGLWAALGVVSLELVVVLTWERVSLVNAWELVLGSLGLLPALVCLAALAGAGGVLLTALLAAARVRSARGTLALIVGLAVGGVGWGVGGGRHLAGPLLRPGFALLSGAMAAVVAWTVCVPVARAAAKAPRAFASGLLGLLLALELVNRLALVRLYPSFHLGLAVATVGLAPLLALAVPPLPPRWLKLGAAALVAALLAAALGLLPGARLLAGFDNYRLILSERAPIATHAVAWTAKLAPPPLAAEPECPVGSPGCEAPRASGALPTVNLEGRDLLLVTVDALRADHLGSYGYARPTTPELDALAREGVRFEFAYCPTPHTSYSITSLMTGKYLRPLLLQGAGADSDTWARLLRTYGYRTAGFYPPAVFFIDSERFASFRDDYLGFEYRKVEFLEGSPRVEQVRAWLDTLPSEQRAFAWVHLFSPHEPYVAHPEHPFGDRDVDRYDSEIAATDRTIGELVRTFRRRRPQGVIVITADHGEEFGEHGGRYHGTSVYEEQVRVPLLVLAPGAIAPGVVHVPVQTIDLLPTVLGALQIPRPPRLRGRDLGPLLQSPPGAGGEGRDEGLALAETEEQVLLAVGADRLVCARKLGACRLYDLSRDPRQLQDLSGAQPARLQELRRRLRTLSASHGHYETQGLRAEGRGWPAPILRGLSGDGDAAEELAALLDDSDVVIRRKAAELSFMLRRPESAQALRLALSRDEDQQVRWWSALALTRLGQGAALTTELLGAEELSWRRWAALALAESGDRAGEALLIAWWKEPTARDFERSKELLTAFGRLRSKDAVWPLVQSLDDVRLRPFIARALAEIGEPVARVPLARALAKERYQSARVAIATALVELGATEELVAPLVRLLGTPDPLPDGLGLALRAGILERVGGPSARSLGPLRQDVRVGAAARVVVPRGGNGQGVRVLVRVAHTGRSPVMLRVGGRLGTVRYDLRGKPIKQREVPRIDLLKSVVFSVPAEAGELELQATLPESLSARPGQQLELVVYAEGAVDLLALAAVPLADELAPPPPRPWRPGDPED